MSDLVVGMWVRKAVAHRRERTRLAALALGLVDLRTARWYLAAAVGEVPLGCDPVVIERAVVVLQ